MKEFVMNQLVLYKELTMSLIDAVNFGDTDLVLDILDERQTIINELDGCDKNLIIDCAKELEIIKMDILLESLMKNKIKDIYKNIKNIKIEKKSVQAYNKTGLNHYSTVTYKV